MIQFLAGREFLLQLALEHLEGQFVGVFETLDAGVTDIFVSRHGATAFKHPLERGQRLFVRTEVQFHGGIPPNLYLISMLPVKVPTTLYTTPCCTCHH